MFSVVLMVSVAFTFFFVPETSGKTLEEIERLYTGEVGNAERKKPSGKTNVFFVLQVTHAAASRSPSAHRVSSLANLKATPSVIL